LKEENERRKQTTEASEKPMGNSPGFAADDVGGGIVANPTHDEGYAEWEQRNAQEEARLKEWAEKQGLFGGKIPKNKHLGGEHAVDFDERRNRFIKATLPEIGFGYGTYLSNSGQQSTPGEYLERLALHNRIFDDDVRIEFVVPRGGGKYSIVSSQPAVRGDPATQEQIDETMRSKGFEPFGNGVYYNQAEGLLIHDMHPRNAVFREGSAVPIDTSIQRVTPSLRIGCHETRRF